MKNIIITISLLVLFTLASCTTQENRQILLAIVGFYFGTAAAGNKS